MQIINIPRKPRGQSEFVLIRHLAISPFCVAAPRRRLPYVCINRAGDPLVTHRFPTLLLDWLAWKSTVTFRCCDTHARTAFLLLYAQTASHPFRLHAGWKIRVQRVQRGCIPASVAAERVHCWILRPRCECPVMYRPPSEEEMRESLSRLCRILLLFHASFFGHANCLWPFLHACHGVL